LADAIISKKTYSERGRVGNANWQVRDNSEKTVCETRLEGKVVRDFVNGQEQVLVGGSTNDVGREPEAPGPERSVAEEIGTGALKAYHGEDKGNCQGLGSAQFEHLGVCLDDGHTARTVRLLCVRPEELVILVLVLDRCGFAGALHVSTEGRRLLARERRCGSHGGGGHR
jgi:hypothetical protein